MLNKIIIAAIVMLAMAIGNALLPAIVVSWLLITFGNLERQRASRFGHYVQRYMTRAMEILRLVGYITLAVGAWYHAPWIIALGLCNIVFDWLNGTLLGHPAN